MAKFNVSNRTILVGDNLNHLRGINSESADLIYLDPPFNKDENRVAPLDDEDAGKIQFEDIFKASKYKDELVEWMRETSKENEELCDWLYGVRTIDQDRDESNYCYLVYMAIRLLECHRILKPTGSLLLHCDDTMSHWLKITLDCIFDEGNFRNEIVWQRTNAKSNATRIYARMTDKIFWYTKSSRGYKFFSSYDMVEDIEKEFPDVCPKTKRRYKDDSSHIFRTPGMGPRPTLCFTWRGFANRSPAGWRFNKARLEQMYANGEIVIETNKKGAKVLRKRLFYDPKTYHGRKAGDLWTGIFLPGSSGERQKYSTQKPLELMMRIIKAMTEKGDVVLDPFCGCATTCEAAEVLHRKWVGIDLSPNAYAKIMERLPSLLIDSRSVPPRRDEGDYDRSQSRYVYVMSNSRRPGWFKVGIAKDYKSRLKGYFTSDPEREQVFEMKYARRTPHYRAVEKHIHNLFENKNEWVKADLVEIKKAIVAFLRKKGKAKK